MIAIFEAVLGNDKREGRTEGPSGKPRPRLKRLGAGLRPGLDPSLFIETRDREARNGVAQWATPFCLLKRLEIQLQAPLKHAVRLADSDDSR